MYLTVLGAILEYMVGADQQYQHRPAHVSAAAASGLVGVFIAIFKLMTGMAAALVWLVGGLLVWLIIVTVRSFRNAPDTR